MSIIYVCDSCGARSEDDVKIYEFGKDVKEYTIKVKKGDKK